MLEKFLKSNKGTRASDLFLSFLNLSNRKRSQVGITITWFVAFIVIFTILLIFVGIVATIASQKGVGKNEISSIESGFNKINRQRELVSFLNYPVEFKNEKMNFEELISRWNKDNSLKNEVEEKISEYFSGKNCYKFSIVNSLDNSKKLMISKGMTGIPSSLDNYRGSVQISNILEDKITQIILNADGNKLILEYGEC